MAASYTATAKRAMCGVSASLNSRGATAAFHPPHTTPSPASENITNTIVLLNEQLAWKAAETYRVWLDAESEASDKIQTAIPTMTQQNKDVYGLHLSFTTTEHTKSLKASELTEVWLLRLTPARLFWTSSPWWCCWSVGWEQQVISATLTPVTSPVIQLICIQPTCSIVKVYNPSLCEAKQTMDDVY